MDQPVPGQLTGGRREPDRVFRVVPDRLRLPFRFEPGPLRADLQALETHQWIDHFVPEHYEGSWTVLPLRAPAGTANAHPILQVVAHPGDEEFEDTPILRRCTAFRAVLDTLGFRVGAVRLLRLAAGSEVKEHVDHELSFDAGWVRLHIPILTNDRVEFVINDVPIMMHAGECWYLRLSDPHRVANRGDTARVHMVIDAPVGSSVRDAFGRAIQEP